MVPTSSGNAERASSYSSMNVLPINQRTRTKRNARPSVQNQGVWQTIRLWRHHLESQPDTLLYAAMVFLGTGLIFMLWNAFGSEVPPPISGGVDDSRFFPSAQHKDASSSGSTGTKLKKRIAIVIPYLPPSDGVPSFPPYFDLFAMSAGGSAAHMDFLIFHCFIPPSLLPPPEDLPVNVILIDLNKYDANGNASGECRMSDLFVRVTDQRQSSRQMKIPPQKLSSVLSEQMIDLPYLLVEYKPAFGHIFADYITHYSHWGYTDIDVVFGDMSRWISHDEWNDYDIVTYGFGDQSHIYLRGQFTFHRNTDKVNQIWRHCKYLSEMDVRYTHTSTLKFESAEGCYSQAVIVRDDVKVKYAVKAFSDVSSKSAIYAHGMYLSLAGSNNHKNGNEPSYSSSVLYTASSVESGHNLLTLPHDWHISKNSSYHNQRSTPLQTYIGQREPIITHRTLYNDARADQDEEAEEKHKNVKCMYWAPQQYQMDLCAVEGSVAKDETVFLEGGKLYKQKFVNTQGLIPEGVQSLPFFHFQEWKRTYRSTQLLPARNIRRQISASMASDPGLGLIITKEGALPLFPNIPKPRTGRSVYSWQKQRAWSYSNDQIISSNWMTADSGANVSQPSWNHYCLKSKLKTRTVGSSVCKLGASWKGAEGLLSGSTDSTSSKLKDSTTVHIVRSPAGAATDPSLATVRGKKQKVNIKSKWWDDRLIDPNNDVTLALTLQITHEHMKGGSVDGIEDNVVQGLLGVADTNVYQWGARQPCVLLIYVNGEDERAMAKTMQLIESTFGTALEASSASKREAAHLQNTLIAVITNTPKDEDDDDESESTSKVVSRKALLNMAMQSAPTRWIVSGLEIERGLLLSNEASIYAMRMAKVYIDMPGHVFVMPQFASKRDVDSITPNLVERGTVVSGGQDTKVSNGHAPPPNRYMFSCIGADLLSATRGKQLMTSALSDYDCLSCDNALDEESGDDEGGDDEEDDEEHSRRLTDISNEETILQQLEDLWWDLSIADARGIPGGFDAPLSSESTSSLDTMAKLHHGIEVSLISHLDLHDQKALEYLRYVDESPIIMIDRLGPKEGMYTLDLVPEVEQFSGSRCYNLLRLGQLAVLGYKISVIPRGFAVSFPKTRSAVCSDTMRKENDKEGKNCDCDLDFEEGMRQILMDEAKRVGKVAVLVYEMDTRDVASSLK